MKEGKKKLNKAYIMENIMYFIIVVAGAWLLLSYTRGEFAKFIDNLPKDFPCTIILVIGWAMVLVPLLMVVGNHAFDSGEAFKRIDYYTKEEMNVYRATPIGYSSKVYIEFEGRAELFVLSSRAASKRSRIKVTRYFSPSHKQNRIEILPVV